MPRTATTPFVILGMLSAEPMSGYELRAAIQHSIGHFWQESYGQIYPTLKRLLDAGLVARTDSAVGGRLRDRYRPTKKARAELERWLAEPPQPTPVRSELLLKVFFGRWAPPGVLRHHLQTTRDSAYAAVHRLEALAESLRKTETSPDLRFWLLTLDMGRRNALARAQWAEHALKELNGED